MHHENAIETIVSQLPTDLKAKLQCEQAIVYQSLQAEHHQDASGVAFWDKLLGAYTPRNKQTILGKTGLNSLAGLVGIKERLKTRVVSPYLASDLNTPHFVLEMGPPGGGKTVTAKKLAEELGVSFLPVTYGQLTGSINPLKTSSKSGSPKTESLHYGELAQRVAQTFEEAKQKAPCVLFFDEISSIARVRKNAYTGNDASITTDAFLQELDKLQAYNKNPANLNRRVIVVGACNNPKDVDSAVRSRGLSLRFTKPDAAQLKAVAFQKLAETFKAYSIQSLTPDLSQTIVQRIIDGAKPTSPRHIESLITAIASTLQLENNGQISLELVDREIASDGQGSLSSQKTSDPDWSDLVQSFEALGLEQPGGTKKPFNKPADKSALLSEKSIESSKKWLSKDEATQMDLLLPETEAMLKTPLIPVGLMSSLLNKTLQHKKMIGIVMASILSISIYTGIGLLAAKTGLGLPLLYAARSILQNFKGFFGQSKVNPNSKSSKRLDAQMKALQSQIDSLKGKPLGKTKGKKPSPKSIKFGNGSEQWSEKPSEKNLENRESKLENQGISNASVRNSLSMPFSSMLYFSGQTQHAKSTSKVPVTTEIVSPSTTESALNQIQDLTHQMGSQMNHPKILLTLATQVLEELKQLAGDDEKGVKFKKEIALTSQWIHRYYEFQQEIPKEATTFANIPALSRKHYRELIYKALTSQSPSLTQWGKAEALRLGYSASNIQQLEKTNPERMNPEI
jgi:DNA polymerase III delta prime subunit